MLQSTGQGAERPLASGSFKTASLLWGKGPFSTRSIKEAKLDPFICIFKSADWRSTLKSRRV